MIMKENELVFIDRIKSLKESEIRGKDAMELKREGVRERLKKLEKELNFLTHYGFTIENKGVYKNWENALGVIYIHKPYTINGACKIADYNIEINGDNLLYTLHKNPHGYVVNKPSFSELKSLIDCLARDLFDYKII